MPFQPFSPLAVIEVFTVSEQNKCTLDGDVLREHGYAISTDGKFVRDTNNHWWSMAWSSHLGRWESSAAHVDRVLGLAQADKGMIALVPPVSPPMTPIPPTPEQLQRLQGLADNLESPCSVVWRNPIDPSDLHWGYYLTDSEIENDPGEWLGYTPNQARRILELVHAPYENP